MVCGLYLRKQLYNQGLRGGSVEMQVCLLGLPVVSVKICYI
jgi:hypothetical protein